MKLTKLVIAGALLSASCFAQIATPMASVVPVVTSCPIPGFCNGIYPTNPIPPPPLPFSGQYATPPKGIDKGYGGGAVLVIRHLPTLKFGLEKPKGFKGRK